MTREEATKRLRGILTEAVEFENSVCYVTEEDREPLEMAIKALEQEPCENAISRQAILDLMRSLTRWCVRSEDGKFNNVGLLYDDVMFGIDKLPPVNPQPKTGHWVYIMVGDMPAQACDRCNTFFPLAYTGGGHNYCPNCGAKMVEPQETETWNSPHAQITAPKGTFERIFNDTDDDSDI